MFEQLLFPTTCARAGSMTSRWCPSPPPPGPGTMTPGPGAAPAASAAPSLRAALSRAVREHEWVGAVAMRPHRVEDLDGGAAQRDTVLAVRLHPRRPTVPR